MRPVYVAAKAEYEKLRNGHGSKLALYPALHRLEVRGRSARKWGLSENNHRAKLLQPDQLSTTILLVSPTDMLRDVWAHHAWADAEHWRVFEAFPAALADSVLFARLHHLHLTQSAWVWAISDRARDFIFSQPGDFTPLALKDFAVCQHEALALIATQGEAALERRIGIPWFTNPPLELTVREGLTQVAMHSHYHRGQNATRLRELGGDPPGTDLITWIWKERPAANW